VLVLVLGAAILLPGLGLTDLWNPDEPRYTEVAREMMLGGTPSDFLVPRLNGEVYAHKPPLLFWAICLSAGLLGTLDEVAARLPVALCGVLTLLVVFDMACRMFSRRAAWVAVAVLASCPNILLHARTARMDIPLVLFVTLAMNFWMRGFLQGRRAYGWLFFASCGLATLTKGPVGLLPPLLSVVVFLWITGHRQAIPALRPIRGLGLWTLIVMLWLAPAAWYGGEDYLRELLFRQNVERYVNPWHHVRPFYYYLQVLPVKFFPWAALLPSVLIYGWRKLRGERRERFLFALCWAVVTIVFFSLSPGKRTVYILTMYPAMALLIGAVVDRLAEQVEASRHWLAWPLGLLAGIGSILCVALPWISASWAELAVLGPRFPWLAASTLCLFAVAALAATVLAWRRRVVHAVAVLAVGGGLLGLSLIWLLSPPFDAFKSARRLSRALVERAAPDEPYGIYPRLDSAFVFYTRRFATVLETEQQLRAFVETPSRVWLLVERDDLDELNPPLPMREVARDQDSYEGYVLLVSR